jgi:predicted secreted acid phosphatase
MNIGIDIDATITEMPEFFAIIAKTFRAAGHKVYIVSYRGIDGRDGTLQDLVDFGIEHDGLYLSESYNESIAAYKGRMARELDIDVFFDDMPEAFMDMPEKTQRLWLCDPRVYKLDAVVEKLTEVMRFGLALDDLDDLDINQ